MKIWGDDPAISTKLAQVWTFICREGLEKDVKEKYVKKYPCPENATALKAPLLDAEVKSALTKRGRRRDTYEVTSQNQLGTGITAITQALEIMSATNKDKDDVYQRMRQCFEILAEAAKLLADLHYHKSKTLRPYAYPSMNYLAAEVAAEQKLTTICLEKSSEKS